MTTKTDQIYINLVIQGNTNAFATLVNKYKVLVYSVAFKLLNNKEEAEEVAQDTFVKAYKNLASFEGKSKFSTWLYKIAYRNCLDVLKKRENKYKFSVLEDVTITQIKATEDTFISIERKERSEILASCLEKLPDDERIILTLFYYQELSLKEIIEVTGFSEANVKVKLHRARKHLLIIVKNTVEPELIKHYGRK